MSNFPTAIINKQLNRTWTVPPPSSSAWDAQHDCEHLQAECWETTLLLCKNEITWPSGVRFGFPFSFIVLLLPVDCPLLPHFRNIFVSWTFSTYSSLHKLWSIWKKVPLFNFLGLQLQTGGGRRCQGGGGGACRTTCAEWQTRTANRISERLCSTLLRRWTGEGGPSAKDESARRGEWMTSGGWRQHVWDWRVRSTQLGRDRTHSWLRPAFLHKTGLWEKGKIRPK